MRLLLVKIVCWLLSAFAVALILVSGCRDFGLSVAVAAACLPGVALTDRLLCQIDWRTRRTALLNLLWLGLAVLFTEYLSLYLLIFNVGVDIEGSLWAVMQNPVLIWAVVALYVLPERLVERKVEAATPPERFITFISDRRKVTVEIDSITIVESNDTEVWVNTTDGLRYRTKAKILYWEEILDDRFVRIHRSYIVNRSRIVSVGSQSISVAGRVVEVSRKYRERLDNLHNI